MSATPAAGRRRRLRWPLAALAVLAAALLAVPSGCGGPRELLIIVVSLDTTRPDHLTPYGYDRQTTPTLATLAEEGVLFTQARSTTSWTLPSHMSLFTGQPPGVHDVVIDFQMLPRDRPVMGRIFREADFRTMGFWSGPYLHDHFGFRRGMDFYERCIEPTIYDLPPEQWASQLRTREALSHTEVSSDSVIRRAVKTLKGRRRPRTLMFLHFFDPHYDFMAPAPYHDRFTDPSYGGMIDGRGLARPEIIDGVNMDEADIEQMRALYDGELAWVDAALAHLMTVLTEERLLKDTLLVITGDHGEEFYENGRFGHRMGLRDEVLRVPLIFWGPQVLGNEPGLQIDDPVALYDILPTLMDYAGLEADPRIYGRSLRPLIEGGHLPPRPVASQLSYFPAEPTGYYVLHEAIVHDGLKYSRRRHIEWSPDDERNLAGRLIPDSEVIEVYDLAVDPEETRNLAESEDEEDQRRVRLAAQAFEAEADRQREAYLSFGTGASQVTTDVSLTEMLQGVGYLGSPQEEQGGR